MRRPRILLVNDDGIYSVGLWAAYDVLSTFADVTVCAPNVQQSATGRSISVFNALRMNKIDVNGHCAYAVDGRPTDALLLGLYGLKCHPDMVVSGVNLGENTSAEIVLTSGTVGAAMEAANQGVPSVVFSLEIKKDADKFTDPRVYSFDFSVVKKVISDLVPLYLKEGLPKGADLVNVNIPMGKFKGYKSTVLGARYFDMTVEKRIDPHGAPYYWICGFPLSEESNDSDSSALHQGYVSVSPLSLNNTAFNAILSTKNQLHSAGLL